MWKFVGVPAGLARYRMGIGGIRWCASAGASADASAGASADASAGASVGASVGYDPMYE
jgi:hypothetical protein